ncbi:hypothetical protein [Roseospira visakhapatnamensis]|uniref:Uncharacterized protein n=1 Tax=Roseospira visakhapatnamensis TaxID=390880 RepID=A0A7W6RHK9_9PROT|nr:hypothetical protein [Roseospira visakhapatnamensis]MBB4268169.1 hypothetical protein [Roseospira visakhapatnamensis]
MPFDATQSPRRPCLNRWHRLRRPALLVLRELAGGVLSACLALMLLALIYVLSACAPLVGVGAVAVGAAGLYCAGVSDAGKQAARDALTGGVPLIACPEPASESPEAGP